ncbi:MAG TPA: alpha/beta hydrolase, partial [Chloroflexia bacterium]
MSLALALIAGLALAGASYEAIAARGDAQTFPPPGRLVDVGGYSLHIQCVGSGSPTVVFDAGLGGTSLDWTLVQAVIGQTTRVCTYDRAGMGRSDNGLAPRTPAQIAGELHTLLGNAGLAGPYVLVGHSLGGITISAVAEARRRKLKALVYLCALLPTSGKTGKDMTSLEPETMFRLSRQVSPDGLTY